MSLQRREAAGQKALHVRGAAADDPVVTAPESPGIAGPGLPFGRHHVRVTAEDDAARNLRADRDEKVRLVAVLVREMRVRAP